MAACLAAYAPNCTLVITSVPPEQGLTQHESGREASEETRSSIGNFGNQAKDISTIRPSVDTATVIPDLNSVSRDRFDQVQILRSVYLAQHNAAHFDIPVQHRFNGYQLAAFHLSTHAIPAWTELNLIALH